ncbi:MAG: DNA-processing protein DprA [Candidatus Omnitrophota bacterium]
MENYKRNLIRLNMIEGIGPIKARTLLDSFKDPQLIFKASRKSLSSVIGANSKVLEAIRSSSEADIEKELYLINKYKVRVVSLADKGYPELLKNIYDPPVVLYVRGQLDLRDLNCVAVVGSRVCSYYGRRVSQSLSRELASAGITVVSGLAKGIDTASHKSVLNVDGKTIAVLGNGLASVYPSENRRLAEDIVSKGGLLISEFSMSTQPCRGNFPRRNRIISGLSRGVVVVEASQKSGALITANFALEQGRDIFAVPGPCDSANSQGPNLLLKDGAKLVMSAVDILDELGISSLYKDNQESVSLKNLDGGNIYNFLNNEPKSFFSIADQFSIKPQQLQSVLLKMEIKGIIKQLPGKMYIRN